MVDVIEQCVGNFGKWQLRTILIIFLCKIPTSWFMAIIIYTAPEPKHGSYWCRPPAYYHLNNTNDWITAAHPNVTYKDDQHQQIKHYDACYVYENVMLNPAAFINSNGGVRPINESEKGPLILCEDFFIDNEFFSLIAQFNLLCSRSLLLHLSQSAHIFGLLCGGVVAYLLLKVLSPRHVMLTGMLTQMICGNCAGLVSTFELHVVFRCLSALTCALMYTSGSTILADITNNKPKIIISIVFELFWSIGLILLPGVSIFCSRYSQLYMTISMPTIFLIFLHRLIPDSPRWYLRKGLIQNTKDIIVEGARVNRRPVPENIDELLKIQVAELAQEPPQAEWKELWDGNPRKRHVFAIHYSWAIYILLFNSMVLNIRAYGREYININTIVMGFSEMFGVFIGMYLILYKRRKWLWTGLISISAGILAYLTWLIPSTLKLHHIVALEMMPCIAIKIATSSSLCILTTCTQDLVSHEKKKILTFSASVWARAWFLWAPFIGVTKVYGTNMPLTVFATLAVIGGCLTSVINHSHHKNHKKMAVRSIENGDGSAVAGGGGGDSEDRVDNNCGSGNDDRVIDGSQCIIGSGEKIIDGGVYNAGNDIAILRMNRINSIDSKG